MKALKQEEPTIPHRDSEWLSKKSDPIGNDKKDSANCLTQKPVGLRKSLNEYTRSDIPQLCEEIAEKYSELLGPLRLKLPPFREVSHKIVINLFYYWRVETAKIYFIPVAACMRLSII